MAEQLINFTPSNQDFDVFEARLIRVSTLHSETCQYLSHPLCWCYLSRKRGYFLSRNHFGLGVGS